MESSDSLLSGLDIGSLGRQFFGLRFSLIDSDELHYLNSNPVSSGRGARGIVLLSALAHETRHFHDSLLSPSTTAAFFDRLYQASLAMSLLPALLAGGNCIPVPLTSWYYAPDDSRSALLAEVNHLRNARGLPRALVAEMPVGKAIHSTVIGRNERVQASSANEALAKIVPILAEYQNEVDYLWGGVASEGFEVSPAHVFEASAIGAQLSFARYRLGAAHEVLLKDILRTSPTYALAIQLNDGRNSDVSGRLSGLRNIYSIIQNHRNSGYGAIVARNLIVGGDKRNHPPGDVGQDAASIFDEWDRLDGMCSEAPTLAGLVDEVGEAEDLIDECLLGMGALGLSDSLMRPARDFAASYKLARSRLVHAILADPDGYADPNQYVRKLTQFPQPLTQITGALGLEMAIAPLESDALGLHDFIVGYLGGERFEGERLFNLQSLRAIEWLLRVGDRLAGLSSEEFGTGESLLEQILPDEAFLLNANSLTDRQHLGFDEGNRRYDRYASE